MQPMSSQATQQMTAPSATSWPVARGPRTSRTTSVRGEPTSAPAAGPVPQPTTRQDQTTYISPGG